MIVFLLFNERMKGLVLFIYFFFLMKFIVSFGLFGSKVEKKITLKQKADIFFAMNFSTILKIFKIFIRGYALVSGVSK